MASHQHALRKLRACHPAASAQRITLLHLYLWYLTATRVERFHPMMTGFWRLKPRTDRRPGSVVDGRLRHLRRRLPELWEAARGYAAVLAELEDAWAATRACARPRGRTSHAGRASIAVGFVAVMRRAAVGAHLWMTFMREMFGTGSAAGALRR